MGALKCALRRNVRGPVTIPDCQAAIRVEAGRRMEWATGEQDWVRAMTPKGGLHVPRRSYIHAGVKAHENRGRGVDRGSRWG